MSKTRKQIALTVVIVVCAVLYVLLGVLSLITKSFPVNAILHVYLRMLIVPLFIKIFCKCFGGQITHSMNKALVLCSVVIFLIDAVRYVLSHGISTVLFLPVCIPICFMITMIYSFKDTGRDKKSEKTLTYLVGIPILLLSLYLEVLSFVQIRSV